jgi:hypothetical protein
VVACPCRWAASQPSKVCGCSRSQQAMLYVALACASVFASVVRKVADQAKWLCTVAVWMLKWDACRPDKRCLQRSAKQRGSIGCLRTSVRNVTSKHPQSSPRKHTPMPLSVEVTKFWFLLLKQLTYIRESKRTLHRFSRTVYHTPSRASFGAVAVCELLQKSKVEQFSEFWL